MPAHPRKRFLLRIPPDLYDVYESWAGDEFRSVNAQIEATLVEAARRAGRLRRPPSASGAEADQIADDEPDTER